MEHEKLTIPTKIRGATIKRCGKVEGYKYVQVISVNGEKTYQAEIEFHDDDGKRQYFCKCFSEARDAAIQVDKFLMLHRKDPVNIFKKK